ncbi:MAG: tRNA (adenosine(37)-N6)-threonylcarbamoyltransferase complex dimerization subunit type 1 TsaB [Bacteroidota bacterium]
MFNILCIETATEICSVALLQDDKLIALRENHEGNAHASQITLLIEAVMKDANIELKNLDAIAVSKGPGSYTGLRVGVSTAKGLCYALDIPLLAINTLESLAHETIKNIKSQNANFCAMLDARRMEVYCAVFDGQMNSVKKTEAKIIDENSFADLLEISEVYFFGNGSAKCKNIFTHPNAKFIDDIKCSAINMNGIAQKIFLEKQFEDVAYFEPFYLKDFVGTIPNKK